MKRRLFFLIASLLLMLAGVQTVYAQKMVVTTMDNQVVKFDVSNVRDVTFEEGEPPVVIDDHECVDLGLPSGTLWATCNVGADSPEDYGDYFAWGETTPKSSYSWGTYKWMTEGQADWSWISKYTFADGQTVACWYSGETFIGDGKKELLPEDDAASVNWGKMWRMPSKEECDELIDPKNTTTEWTTQSGVAGCKITSLKNGKSIFLPATGYFGESGTGSTGTTGNYWARTHDASFSDHAFELFIKQDKYYSYAYNRYLGQSVRPVRAKSGSGYSGNHEYIDLGLPSGTKWATTNVGADTPEQYGDYFAWGETETKPKSEYYWTNYKYSIWDGSRFVPTKYSYQGGVDDYELDDGLRELLPEDDAATVNWGSEWQMPSEEQIRELFYNNNLTRTWTTQNGVNGYKITSKSNGNSIFLPAAGLIDGTEESDFDPDFYKVGEWCDYWSRTLMSGKEYPTCRCASKIHMPSWVISPENRYCGMPVRPVRKQ